MRKPYVSAYTKGRFGNYAYIVMAAYAYSLKHGLYFSAPKKSLAPHQWPVYFHHLQSPDFDESLLTVEVNDEKHTYTDLPFKEEWRDKNILIGTKDIKTGYFQSYKYFEEHEDKIRDAFGLNVLSIPNTCSIHFRGGDYFELKDHHPPITIEYLDKAVGQMIATTGCRYYFVYTDDLKNCLPVISALSSLYKEFDIKFYVRIGGNELQDFKDLMSHQYNITANSSFSVLAATLNPNPDKKVICPHEDNYMGVKNKHLDVSTLYPPSFIRVNYGDTKS